MEKEIKSHSFKLETEAVEDFRKYCEENGLAQAEGFKNLLNAATLEKAKKALPERFAEIENVEAHVRALVTAYVQSLDIYSGANQRAEERVAGKIEEKDKLILELQGTLDKQKLEMQAALEQITECKKIIFEADKRSENLAEALRNVQESLKDKQKIICTLESEKAKFEDLNVKYDDMQKHLADLEHKNKEDEKRIENLTHEKVDFERLRAEAEQRHKNVLKQLEAQHRNALEAAANEKEKAVLASKCENQKRFEDFTLKYEKKLDEMGRLRLEVEKERDEKRKLQAELQEAKKNEKSNINEQE